jgi:hypothetical protein
MSGIGDAESDRGSARNQRERRNSGVSGVPEKCSEPGTPLMKIEYKP